MKKLIKKVLYLLLKKDILKRLSENYDYSMVDHIMRTFGMPTDTSGEYIKLLEQTQSQNKQVVLQELQEVMGHQIHTEQEIKTDNYIEVAEKLYKHVNPTSKMNCPNSVYITTEKWYREWQNTETDLDLFDWCVKLKNK